MVEGRRWSSVLLAFGWLACSGQTSSSHDGASTVTDHHAADPVISPGEASGASTTGAVSSRATTNPADGASDGGRATGGNGNSSAGTAEGTITHSGNVGAQQCSACGPLERCWNGQRCVASMVTVPGGFSIDATEVTRGQYESWIASAPNTQEQDGVCSWNSTYLPDATCMARPSVCQGSACRRHPQPCIDQCDAAAYCKAAGKRLCGAMPSGSVSSLLDTHGQWQNACTSNGAQAFVYGSTFQPEWCNDSTSRATLTEPVASRTRCQSNIIGYRGIFDLLGNVWEWEDNCIGGAGKSDVCNPRGASFGISAAMPNCEQGIPIVRNSVAHNVGFRCCSI
jgi:formylglycine-generating enzyme required for sulfatase activity